MLRMETWFGSAVITDTIPKRLEDYEDLDSLVASSKNISILHEQVLRLSVNVGHAYPVFRFDLQYKIKEDPGLLSFYLIPLGIYMRDRRLEKARTQILREYAEEALALYQIVVPSSIVDAASLTN